MKNGDIPKDVRSMWTRQFYCFINDDASTGDYNAEPIIRCIEKKCEGLIVPTLIEEKEEIYWKYVARENRGVISNWRGTKWDNKSIRWQILK